MTRELERIERILRKIGYLWIKHSDYRFGQLLINYGIATDDIRTWKAEDKGFEQYLDAVLKKENKKNEFNKH